MFSLTELRENKLSIFFNGKVLTTATIVLIFSERTGNALLLAGVL